MSDSTLTTDAVGEEHPEVHAQARQVPRGSRSVSVTRAVTFAAFVVVAAGAVVGNWLRAQNVDPEYTYDIVHRTIKYGGTYYENGIHDKGPLEPFVYHAAAWITSPDGFWYGISFFIAIAAVILGCAAARTARSLGASRNLAVAAAAVMFVHFTLTGADYAGVLYARNMTTALLAIAWIVSLSKAPWTNARRAQAAVLACGFVLGLAVQTLMTTAFTGFAVAIMVFGSVRMQRPRDERARLDRVFVASGIATYLSAPVWYLLRGRFTEFFSGWWTYARFLSTGTGRSFGSQLALGWDQFYAYYEKRPFAAVAILAFVAVAILDWAQADRRVRLVYGTLIFWFVGSWIELILSQRYSSQYFSVSSVPTGLMIAALAGRVYRSIVAERGPIRGSFAWPLVALVMSIYLSGAQPFVSAMHDLSEFTSVQAHAVAIDSGQSGKVRSVRAVLDLVSKNGDPLLAWTNDPWPYMGYHRVSATRFIWESFLTGQIYLGRQSPDYVLPHSWDWFRSDLAQSKPLAFVHSGGGDIPPGSPFDTYVSKGFTIAYPDPDTPVSLRRDVAAQVLSPSTPRAWSAVGAASSPSGWNVSGNNVSYADVGNRDNDRLPIASDSCFSLHGTVDSDGPAGGFTFHFDDIAGKFEPVKISFVGDHVSSSSNNVEFAQLPSATSNAGPVDFTLVVGRRSAALVVGGQVRAALRLPLSARVTVTSERSHLQLHNLRVGAAPTGSGCTN
jgi:hypothetical protein